MLHLVRLLFCLIDINQEIILKWFGIEPITTETIITPNTDTSPLNVAPASGISVETFQLIVTGLCKHAQEGLTLSDIENLLFFIIFVRFILLSIRYNLKTSFYITSIGLFAGYLWYRHLIDLIAMYRSMLMKLPYLHKLGVDAIQLSSLSRQVVLTDLKLGDDVHWYNPGQLLYYGFIRGIINIDKETGFRYYIDPISMVISNLNESQQQTILPIYYKIYNKIIPQLFEGISKFWTQLSGIAAYAVITRIGKKYCPYLVRWHWTFLLIIGFIEQILIYFCYRVSYFQSNILIPQTQLLSNYRNQSLGFQVNFLNGFLAFIISIHLGLIFFGLFHAIWGQYFYFPFLVENTELHIGPRPKNSIYSGGNTAWQDERGRNTQNFFPKLWYGWLGGGTNHKTNILLNFQNIIARLLKRIRITFRT